MNDEIVQRIREAFAVERERTTLLEKKVKELEKLVSGYGTLLTQVVGEQAMELHCSFNPEPFDILKDRIVDK